MEEETGRSGGGGPAGERAFLCRIPKQFLCVVVTSVAFGCTTTKTRESRNVTRRVTTRGAHAFQRPDPRSTDPRVVIQAETALERWLCAFPSLSTTPVHFFVFVVHTMDAMSGAMQLSRG